MRPTRRPAALAPLVALAASLGATPQHAGEAQHGVNQPGDTQPGNDNTSDQSANASSRAKALFVIDRHIRAVGGEDAIRAATSITFSGTFQIQGASFIGRVHSRRAAPGRAITRIELGPLGVVLQGYDGTHAWTLHPTNGPALLEGPSATALARNANPQTDLHYEDNYPTIEYLGDDIFEGEPAFAVRLVDHDGTETIELFSKGDGERIGVRGHRPSPEGPIPYTRALLDYREFERLRMPTRTIERFAGQVITVTITDVSYEPIDPDAFTPPPEVLALIQAPEDAPEPETPKPAAP